MRYVVLQHTGVPHPHFDLMLETEPGSVLATWRCEAWRPDNAAAVRRLPDHRWAYLAYEGPVSGGRGEVTRVEEGLCEIDHSPSGAWTVTLAPKPGRHASADQLILPITLRLAE